jgi:hypothetical protein
MKPLLAFTLIIITMVHDCSNKTFRVNSPDGRLSAEFMILPGGIPAYRVYHSDSLAIGLSRRSGDRWYIAGINGENTERQVILDPAFTGRSSPGTIITDDETTGSLVERSIDLSAPLTIRMAPYGGFSILQ